jgi:hypothetical protein
MLSTFFHGARWARHAGYDHPLRPRPRASGLLSKSTLAYPEGW